MIVLLSTSIINIGKDILIYQPGNCNMIAPKILIIKHERLLAVDINKSLEKSGYVIYQITNLNEELVKKIETIKPNLILLDICYSTKSHGVHIPDIIQNQFQIPVLYLTDYLKSQLLNQTILNYPFKYIMKPITQTELQVAVEIALYKHQIQNSSQIETQRLMTVINSMGCAVVVTDVNGSIQLMNPQAEMLTGWQENEVIGRDLTEILILIDKDTGEVLEALVTQVIETGVVLRLPDNCILISKNGTEIPIGDNIAPIRNSLGEITGAVLVFQDLTQRKQIESQLLHNAFYDGLTALPNRILFLDRLNQALERCKRRHNYRFAVLFLDLDGFKGINDRFGHGIGDDFLVAIARRLESCLRSGDTVARFGGDEFAILLEEIQDVEDAITIARRIQETLKLPIHINEFELLTTASIGIALSCNGYEEPRKVLRDADTAMYHAKEQGKANYSIFDEQLIRSENSYGISSK